MSELKNGSLPISLPDLNRKLEDSYTEAVKKLPPRKDEYSLGDQAIFDRTASAFVDSTESESIKEAQEKKWEQERNSYKPFTAQLKERGLVRTLPPPSSATSAASISIAREIKSIVKEQEKQSPQSLGFYFE